MSNWTNLPQRVSDLEDRVGKEKEIKKVITDLEDKITFLYDKVVALEGQVKNLTKDT